MPLGDDASEGPWGSLAILPSWGGGDPDSNSGGPIFYLHHQIQKLLRYRAIAIQIKVIPTKEQAKRFFKR